MAWTQALFLTAVILSVPAEALQRGYLYPHGRGVPDKILPPQDDVSSPEIFLKIPIVFYNEIYNSIFVNSNGLLSFLTEVPRFYNLQFPLDYPVIAPLYSNVDVRASSGAVYYRETQEELVLDKATRTIRNAFSWASNFEAKSVLLVTWEDVGYHKQGADKVNTFQAIISSDGSDSYAEFLYPDHGIQWIQGIGQNSGLADALAQAGFISGDGRLFTLKGSGTDQIRNLNEWSNADNPGQWLFHIGKVGSDGNIEEPDTVREDDKDAEAFCAAGIRTCHSKATCMDFNTGYCCICQGGYFGNGKNCLSEEIPVRVNGKVSGQVNGVELRDLDLQAYVVPADGRTYTAISVVPGSIGYDMQSVNVLGTTIGWLFARPVKGAVNGYQLTGGVFNQTVSVIFPQTGNQLTLKQTFSGLDVFQQLIMTGEVYGTIPSIPTGTKIVIKDYEEQYTRAGLGRFIARSSQSFQLEGTNVDSPYTVEQTIDFEECAGTLATASTMRLRVHRTFIGYEHVEAIIRYAMTNKVTPLGVEEDPCKDGPSKCGHYSTCVVEGDSHKCVCHPGYELVPTEEDQLQSCTDIDECTSQTHNCDEAATCINGQGSYYCQCNPGYTNEGGRCIKLVTCDDIRCDSNADCVQRSRNPPRCFCRTSYVGNGTHCVHESESRYPQQPYEPEGRYPEQPQESDHRYPEQPQESDNRYPEQPQESDNRYPDQPQESDNRYPDQPQESDNRYPDQPQESDNRYPDQPHPDYQQSKIQDTLQNLPIMVAPICESVYCSCPPHYVIDASETRCTLYTEIKNPEDEDDEAKALVDDHDYSEDQQIPQPICFTEDTCSCPFGYVYEIEMQKCIVNTTELLQTKGPSARSRSCVVEGLICSPNASCVIYVRNKTPACECKPGFKGDGRQCYPDNGYQDECTTPSDCVGDADCIPDHSTRTYICSCHPGFSKNPVTNTCHRESEEDGTYRSQTCLELNDCHPDARCVRVSSGQPECRCNPGFVGDGKQCNQQQFGCNFVDNCTPGVAECRFDPVAGGSRCKCKAGYEGDGMNCTPILTCRDDPSLCGEHASCLFSIDSFICICNDGYVGNGQLCRSADTRYGNFLLVAQGMAIFKVPFQPTSTDRGRPIVMQPYQQAIGLDIDCLSERVFWSDITGGNIYSADYNGGSLEQFVISDIGSAEGISIDWLSRNIFWTDSARDTVEVANLDNSALRTTLINSGLVNPRGIAVHPSRGKIFWADWNRAAPKIEWANMDGSERAIFHEGPRVKLPNSLALDFATDELCWADAGSYSIECIGIGNKHERTLAMNLTYPFGLTISQDHYYWTDWISQKIERATRPGHQQLKPLLPPLGASGKLYGVVAVTDACPRLSNVCQQERGRCPDDHLCLPDGRGSRTCLCAIPQCQQPTS